MSNVDQFWNLSSPMMCRDFLKRVRMGPPPGSAITHLKQKDGKQVTIDEATDEQVLQVANDIAEALGNRKEIT